MADLSRMRQDMGWHSDYGNYEQANEAIRQAYDDAYADSDEVGSDRSGDGFFGGLADSFQAGAASATSGIISSIGGFLENHRLQTSGRTRWVRNADGSGYHQETGPVDDTPGYLENAIANNVNYLNKVAIQNSVRPENQVARGFTWDYLTSANGLANDVGMAAGSSAPTMAAALGVEALTRGRGTGLAADIMETGLTAGRFSKAAELGDAIATGGGRVASALGKADSVLADSGAYLPSTATGTVMDNLTNAGQVYSDAKDQGMAAGDAYNAMNQAIDEGWAPSLAGYAFDRISLGGTGVTSVLGKMGKAGDLADAIATGGGKVAGAARFVGKEAADLGSNAIGEGFQEAWQQNVSDRALGQDGANDVSLLSPSTWTDDMNDSFSAAAFGSLGLSGLGKVISAPGRIKNAMSSNPEVDTSVNEVPTTPNIASQGVDTNLSVDDSSSNTDPDNLIVDTPEVMNTVAAVGGTTQDFTNGLNEADNADNMAMTRMSQEAPVGGQDNLSGVQDIDPIDTNSGTTANPNTATATQDEPVDMGHATAPASQFMSAENAMDITSRAFIDDKEQQEAVANAMGVINSIPDKHLATMKVTSKVAQGLATANNPDLNSSRKITSVGKVIYDGLKARQEALNNPDSQTNANQQSNVSDTKAVADTNTTQAQQPNSVDNSVNGKFAKSISDNPQEQQAIVNGIRDAVQARKQDIQTGKSANKVAQVKSYLNRAGLTKAFLGDDKQEAVARHIKDMDTEIANRTAAKEMQDDNRQASLRSASESVSSVNSLNRQIKASGNIKDQALTAVKLAKNNPDILKTDIYKKTQQANATKYLHQLGDVIKQAINTSEGKINQADNIQKTQVDLDKTDVKNASGIITPKEDVTSKKPKSTGTKRTKIENKGLDLFADKPKEEAKTIDEEIGNKSQSAKELVKQVVESNNHKNTPEQNIDTQKDNIDDELKKLSPRERREYLQELAIREKKKQAQAKEIDEAPSIQDVDEENIKDIIDRYNTKESLDNNQKEQLKVDIANNIEHIKDSVNKNKLKAMSVFAKDVKDTHNYDTSGNTARVIDETTQIDGATNIVKAIHTNSNTITQGAVYIAQRLGKSVSNEIASFFINGKKNNLTVVTDKPSSGIHGYFSPVDNKIMIAYGAKPSTLLHETMHAALEFHFDNNSGVLSRGGQTIFDNLLERTMQYASSTHGLYSRIDKSGKKFRNVISGEVTQGKLSTYRGDGKHGSLGTSIGVSASQRAGNDSQVGAKPKQSSMAKYNSTAVWSHLTQDQLRELATETDFTYADRHWAFADSIEKRLSNIIDEANGNKGQVTQEQAQAFHDMALDMTDNMLAVLNSDNTTATKMMAMGHLANATAAISEKYPSFKDAVYTPHVIQEMMAYGSEQMLSPKQVQALIKSGTKALRNGNAQRTRNQELMKERYKTIGDTDKPILRSTPITGDFTKAVTNTLKDNTLVEKIKHKTGMDIHRDQRYDTKGNIKLYGLKSIFDSPWSILRSEVGTLFDNIYIKMKRAEAETNQLEEKWRLSLEKAFNKVGKAGKDKMNQILDHVDRQGREDFQPTQLRDSTNPRKILGAVVLGPKDTIQTFENEQVANETYNALKAAGKSVLRDYDGTLERIMVFDKKPRVYKNMNEAGLAAQTNTIKYYNEKYGQGFGDAYRQYRNTMDDIQYQHYLSTLKTGADAPKHKWGYVPHIHKPYLVMRRMELTDEQGKKHYQYKAMTSFYTSGEARRYIMSIRDNYPNATFAFGKRFERTDTPVPEEFSTSQMIDNPEEMFNDLELSESKQDAINAADIRFRHFPQTKKFVQEVMSSSKQYSQEELLNLMENKAYLQEHGINYGALQEEFNGWNRSEFFKSKDTYTSADIVTHLGLNGNVKIMSNRFDNERTGAEGYNKDHVQNAYEYANYQAHFIPRSKVMAETTKWYQQYFGHSFGEQPRTDIEKALKNSIDNFRGVPNKFDEKLDTMVTELPVVGTLIQHAFGDKAASNSLKMMLQITGIAKLGLSAATALAQLTAVLNATSVYGYGRDVREAMVTAAKEVVNYRKAIEQATYNGKPLSDYYDFDDPKMGHYRRLLRDVGALDQNLGLESDFQRGSNSLTAIKIGKLKAGAIINSSMALFDMGDKYARFVTAGVAYNRAIKDGATQEEAHNQAILAMREHIFDFTNVDEQGIFQQGGSLGKVLFQFKKYPAKQLSFIYHNFVNQPVPRDKFENETEEHYKQYVSRLQGERAKRIAQWVIPMLALGGAFMIPASGAADEISKLIAKQGIKDSIKSYLADWAGSDSTKQLLARMMMYGLPAAAGINFSGKVSLEDAIPTETSQLYGPTIATAVALRKIFNAEGPFENKVQLALKAMSPQVGNYVSAMTGERIKQSTAKKVYDYTPAERVMKAFGFTPLRDTVSYDMGQRIQALHAVRVEQLKALSQAAKAGDKQALKQLKDMGITPRMPSKKQQEKAKAEQDLDRTQKIINDAAKLKGSANEEYKKAIAGYASGMK